MKKNDNENKNEDKEAKNEKPKTSPIKDFKDIKWNKRKVYIFFDSDKWDKWSVLHAEASLWKHLTRRCHANCKVVNMTEQLYEKTKAKGIDDLLALEGQEPKKTLEVLMSRATSVPPGFAAIKNKQPIIAYHLAKYIAEANQMIGLARGIFAFKDGYYKFIERANLIKHIAKELLEQSHYVPVSGLLSEIYNQIPVVSYESDKDVNPENMHNVNNGILKLSLEDGSIEFLPSDPKIIFTFKAEANYKPDIDCLLAQKFLDEIMPDQKHQRLYLEALAFAILPALRQLMEYTKMIAMFGEGANGKTVLIGFAMRLVGYDACGSTSLDQINYGDKFQLSSLYQKRANFSSENDSTIIKETKTLKLITSGKDGDMVDVEFKFANSFKAKINPIMFFAVNKELSLPADRTAALLRRLAFVDFPYKFVDNPEPGTNERKKNNRLESKEFTQPIVDGLLYLTIEAARELIKRGKPFDEGISEGVRNAALRGSHFERFLHEHIELDPEAKTPSKEIFDDYVNFCIGEGIADEYFDAKGNLKPNWDKDTYDKPCKRADGLTKRLLKHFKSKIKQDWIHHINGKKDRAIKGIKLKVRQNDDEETMAYQENSSSTVGCTPVRQDSKHYYGGGNNGDTSKIIQPNSTQAINNDDVAYLRTDTENTEIEEGTPTDSDNNDGVPNNDKYKKWTEDK